MFAPYSSSMHRTIVTTPSVDTSLRCFSIAFLRLKGWRVKGDLPPTGHKSALIAAPHTSNWDLPYTLTVAFALRLTPYWMGQQNIFKFPFGPLMRWLGGIAVNRQQSTNLVAASAQALAQAKGPLQLIMSPRAHASKRVTGKPVFITSPSKPRPPSRWLSWTTAPVAAVWARFSRPRAMWPLKWPTSTAFTRPSKAKVPTNF